MSRVIVIFGAGSGLGLSVARRFGKEGYRVALVARNRVSLEEKAATLRAENIDAHAFTADLSRDADIVSLVAAVRAKLGRIDAVYYAPTTNEAFIPASDLTTERMRPFMDLWFFGLVRAAEEILPEMRARGAGAILGAVGSNAAKGEAYMSGSGPAQAAARNYLFSLRGELEPEGIHVGLVTINGIIKGSGYHQAVEAGEIDAPIDVPDGVAMPMIDPDHMAETLWRAAIGEGDVDTFYPAG